MLANISEWGTELAYHRVSLRCDGTCPFNPDELARYLTKEFADWDNDFTVENSAGYREISFVVFDSEENIMSAEAAICSRIERATGSTDCWDWTVVPSE